MADPAPVPRSTPRLLLKDGDETRGELPVTGALAIGKDKANDVQLLHPTVSLKHAEIFAKGRGFAIRDVGSEAGTTVNGKRITEKALSDGDEIHCGQIRFVYLASAEAV